MAKDNAGDDGMNEASLDDFFQPPTEDGAVMDADLFEDAPAAAPTKAPAKTQAPSPSAKKPARPKLEDHEAVAPLDESPLESIPDPGGEQPAEADVQDLFGAQGGAADDASTGTVEALDFSDGAPSKDKKKKILIIAGAVILVLLLLGIGYFVFFSGTSAPPAPKPVAKAPPPVEKPAAPAEAPKAADAFPGPFGLLGDFARTPEGTNVIARTLYDLEGKADEKGRAALPKLTKKQFLSLYFGTYVVPAHLEAAKEKLRQWGIKPIQRTTTARIEMLRLKVAEFKDRKTSDKMAKELKAKGFDAFVIKASATSHPVYAGSFFTPEKYAEFAAKLGPAGYPAGEQERVQLDKKVFELWGGGFKSLEEADATLPKILKASWNPRVYLAD